MACDDVAEDDRFIYVEPAEVAKRVLLEDFTGQRCINCPEASELIERLQEEYGADNVIAVGIYGGINGTSSNGTPFPLYTEAGGFLAWLTAKGLLTPAHGRKLCTAIFKSRPR